MSEDLNTLRDENARLRAELSSLINLTCHARLHGRARADFAYWRESIAYKKEALAHRIAKELLKSGALQFEERDVEPLAGYGAKDLALTARCLAVHPGRQLSFGVARYGGRARAPDENSKDWEIERFAVDLAEREPALIEHGFVRFALERFRDEVSPTGFEQPIEASVMRIATCALRLSPKGRLYAVVVER